MREIRTLAVVALLLLSVSVSAQNTINTVAGGGSPLGNGTAPTASLSAPWSMVEDANGNLYISESDGGYVLKENLTTQAVTVFAGTGYAGFTAVSAPATSAPITSPTSMAFDANGNLLIVDGQTNHLYSVNPSTGTLTNVAGSASTTSPLGNFGGDGGPATQALLNGPSGVAVFGTTIYIADTLNNRIRAITNGVITTFAGNGTACAAPTGTCGDGLPATMANISFPEGVAVDGVGNVYIADSGDNKIREVNAVTGVISTVAGTGAPCSNIIETGCGNGGLALSATLNAPASVFLSAGNTFVADNFDNEVREINVDGSISAVAGDGFFGFSGDGGPAVSADFSNPTGVFVDTTGNIFIADRGNNRIREVVASTGNLAEVAGGGTGGDGGPPLKAVFGLTYGLALDAAGDQFIIDWATGRIREVTGGTINTVAGNGLSGFSGDGGPPTSASLNHPTGVAVDSAGNIYITDIIAQVLRKIQPGVVINTYAGNDLPCSPSTASCGDGGPATAASFSNPNDIAVDANGNVFVADTFDNRIRRVDGKTTIVSTVAGTGNSCASGTSACGDGGPATAANLTGPMSVAVDGAGNLFIADTGDNRIRRVDATTQAISTIAFNGQASFSGDKGPATLASMNGPLKVAVDSRGNLFIGGGTDEVVRRVDAATQTVTTVAGSASQPIAIGFIGDGGPASAATLYPLSLAVNSTGGLYIADTGNDRVRFVQLSPTSTTSPANLSLGNQAIGVAGTPTPITLTNTGGDDLLITSIVDANEFSQTNNCPISPVPLAPSQSCTINVTFTPTASGNANDTLIITDNAAGSPHNIPLTASGVAPFDLTTTCTSLTVVQGQSAIYTVDLAPAKGFTQSVSLACTGAPAGGACTVNPSSMALHGSSSVQAKVTATTTPPSTGSLQPFDRSNGDRWAKLIALAGMNGLAATVAFPGKRRTKHARRLFGWLICLCLLSTMATLSSCGVGGGASDPAATPKGTYPLTVTATFKSASGTTFTQNVSFNLVVQ